MDRTVLFSLRDTYISVNNRSIHVVVFILSARLCGNLLSRKACVALGVIEVCENSNPANILGI